MTVLVYRFGLLPPHEGAAFVDDQMWLGHRYRNDLTAIERARREVIRQIERKAGDIPALELALAEAQKLEETAAADLKASRATTRKRSETAAQTQALRDAREERKRVSRLLTEARRAVRQDPEIQAEKKLVDGGPEYDAWRSMIDRCYDQEHKLYKDYGAKGIRVCESWRESLPTFLRDVGKRPTVDQPENAPRETRTYVFKRDDMSGNYEPGNAGWRLSHDVEDDAMNGQRGGRIGALKRGAREISKVGWGIYSRVEAQADAARKAVDKTGLYDGLLPNDPRFSRWRGDGFVGAAQLEGGITVAEIFSGEDTRVKIGPSVRVKLIWDPKARVCRSVADDRGDRKVGERIKTQHKTLHMRLGKGASSTWCSWPMIMHRPIPDGATIKEVVVHRKMRGAREEWYATIVVDTAAVERLHGASGAVAVDLGWRRMDDGGIRIGAWQATDGKTGEVRLTPTILSALTKAASIRSIRDQHFDTARDAMTAWLATQPAIPEWLAAQAHHMASWKSQERMRNLVHRWKANRFVGDEQAYTLAEAWCYRDHHLWCYEEGARTRALRRRKQLYRIEAKRLAAMYHTLVLEDFDLSEMAKRPELASAKDVGGEDAPSAQRQLVAPSDLRSSLIHAFAVAQKVPSPNTTRMCNACGVIHAFDAKKDVWRVPECPECGITWDQDYNAARNMLDLWRDGKIIEPKNRGGVGEGRSRFERAKMAGSQTKDLGKRAAE